MINRIIDEALIAHRFTKELETDLTTFYKRESKSEVRFAILHKLNELSSPAELNTSINRSAPDSFLSHPSFKKNCDLICIHHLQNLKEFKDHEEQIFALEEDPHFFKKYILYYSDIENTAIQEDSYGDLERIISDKKQFRIYKSDPLAGSQYSVAAKIFIKLPFLELPLTQGELVPLRLQADEAVAEEGLDYTYATIKKFTQFNADELMEELIANELENRTN